MSFRFGAATHVGCKRFRNEDTYCADPGLGLFLVADGMGGHAAGEVASTTVADAVRGFITETQGDDDRTWPESIDPALSYDGNRLRAALFIANQSLARRIEQDARLRGMAATISGALCRGQRAVVANVGDCRAYLIRHAVLQQLTHDHSWVAEQVRAGLLTVEAARVHPWRNLVTRAVTGAGDFTVVDVRELDLMSGDRLLLCSDGLHGVVTDVQILEVALRWQADLTGACQALIDLANTHGGPDNVTAILVERTPPSSDG